MSASHLFRALSLWSAIIAQTAILFLTSENVVASGYREIPLEKKYEERDKLLQLHEEGNNRLANRWHEIVENDPEFAFQLMCRFDETFALMAVDERLKFLTKLLRQPDDFWEVGPYEDPRDNGYRFLAITRIRSKIREAAPALITLIDHLNIHKGDDRRKMARIVDDWAKKIEHDNPNTAKETESDGAAS